MGRLRLPIHLEQLLARAGLPAGECRVLETLVRPGGKTLLRLRGPERQQLKVRSFASPDEAASMVRLRGCLGEHPGFSRILTRWGRYVLEEWVKGLSLASEEPSMAQARACGALLADLHQISSPGYGCAKARMTALVEESRTRLQGLADVGALAPNEAARLGEQLQAGAPLSARHGLIHFDFCGENLVWAEGRGVVSIDNERLRPGPLAYDIGRTMARWPLSAAALEALLAGYRAAGGPAEASDRPFWMLMALVTSAWFRVRQDPPAAELPLRALRDWRRSSGESGE